MSSEQYPKPERQRKSRRTFLRGCTVAAATSAAKPVIAQGSGRTVGHNRAPFETRSRATRPWSPVRAVDTERMPWKQTDRGRDKTLFLDESQKVRLAITQVFPGHTGLPCHYHTGAEWTLYLAGDLPDCEYTSPDQRVGAVVHYR